VSRSGTTALSLSEEIRQRFDEFSRSQKDVGQYIVDHLEEAAFHTAEELARRANTSSSTVVRFAQALGFDGFPELQTAARDEYRRGRDGGEGQPELAVQPLFPIDQTEFEAALAADHANLAETARRVDRDEVTAAVDLISRAERIVLCGTDQMAFFASYLRHLLMLLDLRAEVVASPSQEGLAKLGRVDESTVMVGFSAGRPHPLVVGALKLARHPPHDRDRRRNPLRGREARRPPALLLLEQPRLRPVALGPAGADPGAGLRRLRARRVGLRRPHQGLPAQVAHGRPPVR
jgi:DNA-binding MurR/RpiR family transcriptional regulator